MADAQTTQSRKLIVCCDGTWNRRDAPGGAPTNVAKMARALRPSDGSGVSQLIYYHPGVGTGNRVDHFLGGAFGIGLSGNVQSEYAFLADNFQYRDQIFLFGFSRGAYTVRSLAGLIGLVAVERWPIDRLIPYAKNSRTHSEAQKVAQVAASMKEWGWTNPVLADEAGGVIAVAGHARILAARQLGIDEVPVMVARGWADAQKRAYVIADNQLALNAGWDRELLGLELGELKLAGFDLALSGFGELELGDLLADRTQGLTDPDDAPAVPEHPVSRTGDLWLVGRHRLLCGDCRSADDMDRLLGEVSVDCVFTSPPYAVGIDYGGEYQDTIDNLRGMLPSIAALWAGVVEPGGFAVINFSDIAAGSKTAVSAAVSW